MGKLSLVWKFDRHGWASFVVSDGHAQAEGVVSYITDGPEQLLDALTRLIRYEESSRAEFEAEPVVYRWCFDRKGGDVDIRLLEAGDRKTSDDSATLIWESRQPIDSLARAVIRSFDTIANELGDSTYQSWWRRPFPRHELETLRVAWRQQQSHSR